MISQPDQVPDRRLLKGVWTTMQTPPPPPPGGSYPPPGGYPPPPAQPPAAYTPQPAYGAPQSSYGGFWIRLIAVFIDGIILGIPLAIIGSIIGAAAGAGLSNLNTSDPTQSNAAIAGVTGALGIFYLFAFVIEIGYFVFFWGRGGTLGMKIFKLRVADATTGQPIGMGRAFIRFLGYIISAIPCYIGLIWAAFDARKQGWHDKIANTVVLQG